MLFGMENYKYIAAPAVLPPMNRPSLIPLVFYLLKN